MIAMMFDGCSIAKNLFGISGNSQKKTMMTKIIMIFMIIGMTTVRKNHENHGNLGQKITHDEMINSF